MSNVVLNRATVKGQPSTSGVQVGDIINDALRVTLVGDIRAGQELDTRQLRTVLEESLLVLYDIKSAVMKLAAEASGSTDKQAVEPLT